MPGNWSINSRAVGELLTAAKYNADHALARDNDTPAGVDDYSGSVGTMRTLTDPGEFGSESFATSLAGELERLRFTIREMKGGPVWYTTGWGVHDRNVVQTIVTNTTTPTNLYSISMQNFHNTDGGLELRTVFDVFQNAGSPQNLTVDVLFGGQTLFSSVVPLPNSASLVGMEVRAYTLSRGLTSYSFGGGTLDQHGQNTLAYLNPRITLDTTAAQTLQVRVTMDVASTFFTVTHGHTQLWRQ